MSEQNKFGSAKQAIADAFEECLRTKSVDKITVSEIMRRANMTRQIFYNHFNDVHDLVSWMHLQKYNAYIQRFWDDRDFMEAFKGSLMEMRRQKHFYRKVADMEGQNSFSEVFFEQTVGQAVQHIGSKRVDADIEFSLRLFFHGVVYMIIQWIKSDMIEEPEVVARRIYNSLPVNLMRFYE